MKKYLQIFILTGLLIFSFQKTLRSQWFKLPDLPDSGKVFDMQFVNVNTGWITLFNNISSTCRLIKTTNGGQNWNILIAQQVLIFKFFNDTLGIALNIGGNQISKTSNGGTNWNIISTTGNVYQDIFFVSKDTGWVCGFDGMWGGVWRTNDGGNSWFRQYTAASNGLDRIFFLKNKVNGEYWGWTFKGNGLWRTTNSGNNWTLINGGISGCSLSDAVDIYFKDTMNGVITRSYRCFSTTTDGGFNWIHHYETNSNSSKIGVGDNNTIWITNADSVIKTINFFITYGKQKTPTLVHSIFALDTSLVYAGLDMVNMVKTTNGGGPIIYTGIDSLNLNLPVYYKLYQNYPNPFNPVTKISYELPKDSKVSLIIYDILGKEIRRLVDNEFKQAGIYSIDFNEPSLASGVYFYRLVALDSFGKTSYNKVKSMVYIK
jgi:photosystem II stability/assembly factor-like uncharacterized protein